MLGSSLCRVYHNIYEVSAFHRDDEYFGVCSAAFSLDLMDTHQLQLLLSQIKPDLVIHCASLTSLEGCEQNPDLAMSANVSVSENVTRSCSAETKLVYISTDQVYGLTADRSETNMNLKPISQYGKTKYLGEQKCIENNPNSIIIRTNIFGWNVNPAKVSSAEWIYNSLKREERITLFTDYIFSPVYTEYLGEIIMQLADMDFSGIINIGSPLSCSKYEFGIQLAEEFGFDKSLINKGLIDDHDFEAQRPKNLKLNTEKLNHLGIKIPDYRESIKKFSQYT